MRRIRFVGKKLWIYELKDDAWHGREVRTSEDWREVVGAEWWRPLFT